MINLINLYVIYVLYATDRFFKERNPEEIDEERQEKRKRRSAQIEDTYMYVGCSDSVIFNSEIIDIF